VGEIPGGDVQKENLRQSNYGRQGGGLRVRKGPRNDRQERVVKKGIALEGSLSGGCSPSVGGGTQKKNG